MTTDHPQIEHLPTDSLVPYARNSRTHSAAQITAVAASITEFGFTNPVLIDADGGIIAGHGRVMAAKQLGRASVPCLRLAHLTPDQRRAYVIADNKLAELAGWDDELLALEMRELQSHGYALELTGFLDDEIADLLFVAPQTTTDPNAAPPVEAVAISKTGDVWILGAHRIMCGDSTDAGAIALLMNGQQADACWTDPPYNVAYGDKAEMLNDYEKGHRNTSRILNDDMSDTDFRKFLAGFYRTTHAAMKKGAAIYVSHSETERANFTAEFLAAGFKLSGVVIWRKDCLVLGRSDYQWIHEPVLYGWKEGGGAQVFWRAQTDHRQRHRKQRVAIRQAKRRQVADQYWRGSHDRRWCRFGGVGRGFHHA